MKRRLRFVLAVAIFLSMLVNPFINLSTRFSVEAQINENIEEAKAKIQEAYNATVEAERTGAKVSEAIEKLNNALDYISQAENRSAEGDLEQAFVFTENSIQLSEETLALVQELKQQAESLRYTELIVYGFISVVVLVLGVVTFFYGRRMWKRHQQNKFMEMRVKVKLGSK